MTSTDRPDEHPVPHEPSRAPRTGTILWGIILAVLGLGAIGVGLGLSLDLQLSLIVLLVISGAGLLVKALLPRSAGPQP